MEQKTDGLNPSAPLENIDSEQRLEKKLNNVNSFNNSVKNIKQVITYFKDKKNKSRKKYEKHRTLTTILKSFDTIVINATTSSSITLSLTRIGLGARPISIATACGILFGNKVTYETMINKYNKYKKQYEKDQQTIKSLDKVYRKTLQDNVIDKNEYESLCNIFTKFLLEIKIESFFKNMNIKTKLKFFSHNTLKFNLKPES